MSRVFHFQNNEADSAADGSNIYLVIIIRRYNRKTSVGRMNHTFTVSYSCSVPYGTQSAVNVTQNIISGNSDFINKVLNIIRCDIN